MCTKFMRVDDFEKRTVCLTRLKSKKLKIKNEIVEKYQKRVNFLNQFTNPEQQKAFLE